MLHRRGQRAVAMVYKKFHQLGIESNIDLKLRLFNAIAVPNLTFGCEVWGPWLFDLVIGHDEQSVSEQVRTSQVVLHTRVVVSEIIHTCLEHIP